MLNNMFEFCTAPTISAQLPAKRKARAGAFRRFTPRRSPPRFVFVDEAINRQTKAFAFMGIAQYRAFTNHRGTHGSSNEEIAAD
jgi:hypothetical protein